MLTTAGFNRRMRKTACPVVWKAHGAQSPWAHPIQEPVLVGPQRLAIVTCLCWCHRIAKYPGIAELEKNLNKHEFANDHISFLRGLLKKSPRWAMVR
jgi:hypothetical protein